MQLSDFMKEYYDEIENCDVQILNLLQFGLKKKTLAKELFLRENYGDKIIYDDKQVEQTLHAKKSITRLGDSELNIKKELQSIYDSIDNSTFDKSLDMLGISIEGI